MTMQLHETQTFHFTALWVKYGVKYPCPSFQPIQDAADYVQDFFDNEIITNIEETPASKAFSSNRTLFLEQTSTQVLQKGQIELYDSLGQLVKKVGLEAVRQNEWELVGMKSGIYFYQVIWEKGQIEGGKLVIQ